MTNYARRPGDAYLTKVPYPPVKTTETPITNAAPAAGTGSITTQSLRQDAAMLLKEEVPTQQGALRLRTGHACLQEAMALPESRMLFSEFWHEGELCILFADTNLGKSILAVQIGDSISRGVAIPGFKLEAAAQAVVYCDFELSDKQFETRYRNGDSCHNFHPDFYRADLDPDADMPDTYESYEDFLTGSMERAVVQSGAKVLIIDNLTYLRNETEKAKDALPLMKQLKALKQKHRLSILALAHTPKRDSSQPITRNDLQGSKMLINFCDSAFAIGESTTDKDVRYLKQIKQRHTGSIYGEDNVCVCSTLKPDNFLMFQLQGYGTERQHLAGQEERDKQKLVAKAQELSAQGMSQRQVAKELNLSLGVVNKYVNMAA